MVLIQSLVFYISFATYSFATPASRESLDTIVRLDYAVS